MKQQGSCRPCLAVLAAVALLLASCGTRLNDDERALVVGGGSAAGGAESAAGSTSGSRTPGSGVPAADGGAGGGSPDGTPATPGGEPAAEGPSDGEGAAISPAGLPCEAPTEEIGVTDDTLAIGGVYQLSGLLPGFAQTASLGALAYVEYLNANGGLCGRQVEYVVLDDGFDAPATPSRRRR